MHSLKIFIKAAEVKTVTEPSSKSFKTAQMIVQDDVFPAKLNVGETKGTEGHSLIGPTLFGLILDKLVIVFALYFVAHWSFIFALFSLQFFLHLCC